MSSTYSPDLRIELIGTGDQAGVWVVTTNNNLAYVLEQAVAGYISVAVASANQAFTYINGGSATAADNQSVHAAIALTTSTGANFSVYAPPASKQYTIYNASSYTATIYNSTVIGNTTAAGTGVAIPAGKTMTVWSDGTNFSQQNTHLISPTLASPTMTTPVLGTPTSGTLTNCTGLPVNSGISGLGANVATFLATPSSANLRAALTDETGTGAAVFATSPSLTTPDLGTPSAVNLTNATNIPTNQFSGTIPVSSGGTGATSIASGSLVKGNGTSAFSAATASDIVTAIGSTAVANATNAVTANSANSISSSVAGTAISGLSPYAVGTYAWGYASGIGAAGDNTSSFYPANFQTNASPPTGLLTPTLVVNSGGTTGGTWKCMSFSYTNNSYQIGLFLRIS